MYNFTDNDYKNKNRIFRHFHQIKSYNLVTKRLQKKGNMCRDGENRRLNGLVMRKVQITVFACLFLSYKEKVL